MLDLHDSEIIAIEKGPMAWIEKHQGSSMDLEGFRRAVIDQFKEVGFVVEVKCFETSQPGCYAFDLEIRDRISSTFDPDRQVHEIVNNLLELPDQEGGFIKTDRAMLDDLAAGHAPGKKHQH